MPLNFYQKITIVAIESLLNHKLRCGLSILGIICGVTAIVAMFSIGEGARKKAIEQIENLGTNNIYIKSQTLGILTTKDAERISKSCTSIESTATIRDIDALPKLSAKDTAIRIMSCSPNLLNIIGLKVIEGRFISEFDVKNRNLIAVIGNAASRNFGQEGKTGGYIRLEDQYFKVAGIIKRANDLGKDQSSVATRDYSNMIFLPSGTSLGLKSPEENEEEPLNEIIIKIAKKDEVIDSATIIKRSLKLSHKGMEDYEIIVPLELLNQAEKTNRIFDIVLGSIAFISLLVGGIGIMNIMLATVTERTREIGIRRAVGASKFHIITQFLIEAVILTTTGGVLGVITGVLSVVFVSVIFNFEMSVTFKAVIIPLIMAMLTGIFFGLYPAKKASDMDPAQALSVE
ncbi:MAG: ABC transporter permease [Nitrospirae bacterium]|nr:ABC transporter permease [Nitrospirota bacterium]MBF0539934.1 ABC transporter permease [Nitrospirota bacterium]